PNAYAANTWVDLHETNIKGWRSAKSKECSLSAAKPNSASDALKEQVLRYKKRRTTSSVVKGPTLGRNFSEGKSAENSEEAKAKEAEDGARRASINNEAGTAFLALQELFGKFKNGSVGLDNPENYLIVRQALIILYGDPFSPPELHRLQRLCSSTVALEDTATIKFIVGLKRDQFDETIQRRRVSPAQKKVESQNSEQQGTKYNSCRLC
ncbi:hypothetical protein IFR04_014314, partial [Cadophora malorum]